MALPGLGSAPLVDFWDALRVGCRGWAWEGAVVGWAVALVVAVDVGSCVA